MANIVDVARWLEANPGIHTLAEIARGAGCSTRSAGRSVADLPFARPGLVERLQRGVYLTPARSRSEESVVRAEPERQPEPELQGELIMPSDYDDGYDDEFPEPEFDYYVNGNGPADDEFITRPVLTIEISRYFKGKDGLRRFVGKDTERNRRLMLRYDTPGGRN